MTMMRKTWLIPAVAAALLGAAMAQPPAFAQTNTGTPGTAGGTATAGGDRPKGADDNGGATVPPSAPGASMTGRHTSKMRHHGRRSRHSATNSGMTGMHSSRRVGARNHSTDGTAGGRVGTGPTDTGTR